MADRAVDLGVGLRPHAKTAKSPDLLAEVVALGAAGLTVSTLGEIRTLRFLTSDLMYAVPMAPGKGDALLDALGAADVRLSVVLDDVACLPGVPADPRIDVVLEVDADGHRGGIDPGDPRLEELAE